MPPLTNVHANAPRRRTVFYTGCNTSVYLSNPDCPNRPYEDLH
jgi:hypothetical protein